MYYEWRKVSLEFMKRLDPTLPFYYFTSGHHRYYEEEMPSFNEQVQKTKTDRHPRRELMACAVSRRATFAVRGSLSVRAQFHNLPVSLPPLPTASVHDRIRAEHSYV